MPLGSVQPSFKANLKDDRILLKKNLEAFKTGDGYLVVTILSWYFFNFSTRQDVYLLLQLIRPISHNLILVFKRSHGDLKSIGFPKFQKILP